MQRFKGETSIQFEARQQGTAPVVAEAKVVKTPKVAEVKVPVVEVTEPVAPKATPKAAKVAEKAEVKE